MLTGQSGPKVVLFSPPYEGKVFGPPLGLLSLASSLREAGFTPVIVDGATDPQFLDSIRRHVSDAVAFGVSVLTGPMIRPAIDASRLVRRLNPALPIIYGGWHPTLVTGDTLRESFVDIVVRHQGELTLTEILKRRQAGGSLDLVAGCWFKRNGAIVVNADRPASPLSAFPPPAYDQVDFEAYARLAGARKLPFATSIGCPYACNYCTDMVFYHRRFNPLDVERVVAQVTSLVRQHRVEELALVDSNFLVDTHRALAIARGFLGSGVRFRWTFQASTDLLCRMSYEDVSLLAESGVSHIGFGTESAAPDVLRMMHKSHQRIEHMYEAAGKCANAGIRVTYNLIFGYPGEEERHRRQTLEVMGKIAQQFENVTFSPNLFTPYPGIPIWPELRAAGLNEPASLEEWAQIGLGQARLPWLREAERKTLERSMSYFLLANQLGKAARTCRSKAGRWGVRLLRMPLHWRLAHARFRIPVELWLATSNRWLTVRRSLLTGDALSSRWKESIRIPGGAHGRRAAHS